MKYLEAAGLTFTYKGTEYPVLNGADFAAERGERIVINGLSGCGKSTFLYIIAGIIPSEIPGSIEGRIMIDGCSTADMSRSDIVQKIGTVFQNPDDQIVCRTVEDEIAFGLENLCVSPAEIRRRVDECMRKYGFEEFALKDPMKLSGGEKKLLSIAGVLVMESETIILDEPYTGLDDKAAGLVSSVIDALQSEGRTLLIAEHNPLYMKGADRVLRLENGKFTEMNGNF
ncbi:MAG: energy-coupling factor ABC transporter ATP-binding protein [Anaerovoracaceae bacterium]